MKFTIDWLKEHLDTKYSDNKIVDKLTDIGLEVENFQNQSSELDNFVVAKILKIFRRLPEKLGEFFLVEYLSQVELRLLFHFQVWH